MFIFGEVYKTTRKYGLVLEKLFPERREEIVSLTELYQDARYSLEELDPDIKLTAKGVFQSVISAIKNYTKK